jgi:hypothetical protein
LIQCPMKSLRGSGAWPNSSFMARFTFTANIIVDAYHCVIYQHRILTLLLFALLDIHSQCADFPSCTLEGAGARDKPHIDDIFILKYCNWCGGRGGGGVWGGGREESKRANTGHQFNSHLAWPA